LRSGGQRWVSVMTALILLCIIALFSDGAALLPIELSKNISLKNICFVNHIHHKKIASYLNNSDVFVLFSNYENLPCVILEAFACGVPVVATNVGGISEYFPKDFGFLVEPKDKSAFKSAILNIYNSVKKPDKQLMHQYAKKHFGQQAIATSFSELYIQSLSKSN